MLFLPINAGMGGIWPLALATLLIAPMTYFSHRGLSRFVCASPNPGDDITAVARESFGRGPGLVVTILYFLAIFPIVLIYGVSITNTVDSLLVNQLGLASPPRAVLAFVLIPSWDLGALTAGTTTDVGEVLKSLWLVIPVLVFAFNHSPAISQFSLAMQRRHGQAAAARASAVLARTTGLLVVFTMFFVWSCVLALGPDGMAQAKEQNLPVLSYLANVHDSPLISALGPIVAILAIISSFFGHYLGTAEGAEGIVRSTVDPHRRIGDRTLRLGIAAFLFVTTWLVAIANPGVLELIETVAGPVIAIILYLMPMYAIRRLPALAAYRGALSNVFVTLAGLVAVSGIVYGVVRTLTGA